jgi:hypothetical protein
MLTEAFIVAASSEAVVSLAAVVPSAADAAITRAKELATDSIGEPVEEEEGQEACPTKF